MPFSDTSCGYTMSCVLVSLSRLVTILTVSTLKNTFKLQWVISKEMFPKGVGHKDSQRGTYKWLYNQGQEFIACADG